MIVLTFLMWHRAKKRKRKEAIIGIMSFGKTEAGENGLQDSEIPTPGESIHGKSECNTEAKENWLQDSEIIASGESIHGKSEWNTVGEVTYSSL